MEKEQHRKETSMETDDSTCSDDPDKGESEDCHEQEKPNTNIHTPHSVTGKWHNVYVWGVAVAAILVLVQYKCTSSVLTYEDNANKPTVGKVKSHIAAWRGNYPNQNHETWNTIAGQMMEFVDMDNASPLVFVMAYNEAHKTTNILASEITRAALQLKDSVDKCGDLDIVKVSGSDKKIKSGFFLNNFLPQIKNCRKMILYNLEELDGSVAKDLHSLIDPDFPNVHNTVFIFTVKIPNFQGNVYSEVQKTLRNRWSAIIEPDKLNPLLSRLVNNIKIIPEPAFDY